MQIRHVSPRFIAIGWAPRYGSRDEIVGSIGSQLAVAETEGWLDHLLQPWFDYDDLRIEVIDRNPEKVLANWGPKLPTAGFINAEGALEIEELPF
jgi:hypothetical protein